MYDVIIRANIYVHMYDSIYIHICDISIHI